MELSKCISAANFPPTLPDLSAQLNFQIDHIRMIIYPHVEVANAWNVIKEANLEPLRHI